MEHLNGDMVSAIVFYLGYIQIVAFALTCKDIRSMIEKHHLDFSLIIKSKLAKIFGSDADLLHENLSKYQRYLCGSFVLQAIYGEEWNNSDIDIFYIRDFMEDSGVYKDKFIFNQNETNYGLNFNGMNNRYLGTPIQVAEYNVNSFKIDYVSILSIGPSLRRQNIFTFHEQFWDIDICMVVYDGNKLYIKNLENLFTKRATARYIKPFTFNKYEYLLNLFKIYRNIERIKKYNGRGFTIKLEYDVYNTVSKERNKLITRQDEPYIDYMDINVIYWEIMQLLSSISHIVDCS